MRFLRFCVCNPPLPRKKVSCETPPKKQIWIHPCEGYSRGSYILLKKEIKIILENQKTPFKIGILGLNQTPLERVFVAKYRGIFCQKNRKL